MFLRGLGTVYLEQRRWADAEESYEAALRISRDIGASQDEGLTLQKMGILYERQGKMEKTVALWREALTKLHPDSPEHKQVAEWLQSAG